MMEGLTPWQIGADIALGIGIFCLCLLLGWMVGQILKD